MKKFIYLPALLLFFAMTVRAQDTDFKQGVPCYTKHWVDSVNTANTSRIRDAVPIMFEWYAYEGQTQPVPAPANMINVIRVKLEETCPQEEKKGRK